MSSSSDQSHRATFFSRLSSSATRSSSPSSSIISNSTQGAIRLRYARDSKGHDLSSSYPFSSTSSSASSTHGEPQLTNAIPTLSRLVYAKDSRGLDLSTSYPHYSLSTEDETILLSTSPANAPVISQQQASNKKMINRYAKDGKGVDFNATYPYCTSAMNA